jgi:glycosyltransferase involved in cell wall biosynthesis
MLAKLINSECNATLKVNLDAHKLTKPQISFVVPVFNQQGIIYSHLKSIVENSSLEFELIIIDDASEDTTRCEILRFIQEEVDFGNKDSKCSSLRYYENKWPWFETRCDDFGIRIAKSDIVIEVQADMLIKHPGFDSQLASMFNGNRRLIAISARGVHPLRLIASDLDPKNGTVVSDNLLPRNIAKKIISFSKVNIFRALVKLRLKSSKPRTTLDFSSDPYQDSNIDDLRSRIFPAADTHPTKLEAGWLGGLIDLLPYNGENEVSKILQENIGKFWSGETVMRGPLAVNREAYIATGGFNTQAFFQGNDDHDLFMRAASEDYMVGFTPINFASPTALGNGRKKRSVKSRVWTKFHKRIRAKGYSQSELVNKIHF